MTAWTLAIEALPYVVITGLFGVVIAHYRKIQSGDLLPRATVDQIITQHDEQLQAARQDATDRVAAMRDELNRRMDNFRSDQTAHLEQIRLDHASNIAQIREDHASVLAARDRELDKLYAAWNLEAEANRQTVNSSQDQITAAANLVTAMAQSVQQARRQLEVAAVDNHAATGGTGA